MAAAGGVNALVTASHLVAALAKLLLYDLDRHFPAERVFSAVTASKTDVFTRVIQRHLVEHGHAGTARSYSFGNSQLPAGVAIEVVGDGSEEEAAAQRLGLRFVKVEKAQHLCALAHQNAT